MAARKGTNVSTSFLHHLGQLQRETPAFSENSSTQNEDHKRRCSLFSIERQFPKRDVAGSIPGLGALTYARWRQMTIVGADAADFVLEFPCFETGAANHPFPAKRNMR
jgi:hypothetical protein